MNELQKIALTHILTRDELVKMYPTKFTNPQLNWLLRNRKQNGLEKSGAVFSVGRKFYINLPLFTVWLTSKK
jgi:hypothetical protein